MILSLAVLACAGGAVSWDEVSIDATVARGIAATSDGILVLDERGALWSHEDGTWGRIASPPARGVPQRLVVGPDGSVWGSRKDPGTVWLLGEKGWGVAEFLPSFISGWAPGRGGEAFACLGYVCSLYVRRADGEWRPRARALGYVHAGGVQVGGEGYLVTTVGVFQTGTSGLLERVDVPASTESYHPLPDGRLALGTPDGIAVWDGETHTPWLPPGVALKQGRERVWSLSAEGVQSVVPSSDLMLRLPETVSDWTIGPDGSVWVVGRSGAVFISSETPKLGVRDVSTSWSLPATALTQLLAADLDADGLDDVVGVTRGELRSWVQEGRRLVDRTDALGLGLDRVRSIASCRLDEGAEPWFLVERTDPSSLTVLRPSRGRYSVSADLDLSGCGDPSDGVFAHCHDLDGDLDEDVLVGCGNKRWRRRDAMRMWRNDLGGHLSPVLLPQRGINQGTFQYDARLSDFDDDGRLDFVSVEPWSNGLRLFRGLPGGSMVDVSAASGLHGWYPEEVRASFVDDHDGDGRADLIVVDRALGVRAWRGRGDLSFDERTDAWGLAAVVRRPHTLDALLEDLDGDGVRDLVLCGGGCDAMRGRSGRGFYAGSVPLPVETDASRVVALRLGPDGHRGLLVASQARLALLQVSSLDEGGVTSPASSVALPWLRAWRWLGWLDAVGLALAMASTGLLAWRRGVVLGAGLGMLAIGVFALIAPLQTGASGLGALVVGVGAVIIAWVPRARAAMTEADDLGNSRYTIKRVLGRGGAAVVYEALDTELDRTVALKVLKPDAALDAKLVTRLRTEARTLARLRHPHLVEVYTSVELAVGPALVLEYMPGGSLQDRLDRGEVFGPDEAVDLTIKVAQAVGVAHALDILHRDIKPANVLLNAEGQPGLADFGIARTPDARLTVAGGAVGTFVTMAPEQRAGRVDLDQRVDVYGLGAMLFTLVTGVLPVGLDNPELRDKMLDGLPARLVAVIVAATRADRDKRIHDVAALVAALRDLPSLEVRA